MKRFVGSAVGLLGLAVLAGPSVASTLTFYGNTEFSGGTSPAGSAPWLTAVFDDSIGPNSLLLTISTAGLTGSEKLTEFSFNIDEALTITGFTASGGTAPAGTVNPADLALIGGTAGAYKADGDGYFDILIDYPTSGDVFGAGETSKWTISGTGLTLASLLSLSTNKDGTAKSDGLLFAAHVQSIGTSGQSGWITGDYLIKEGALGEVPVPAALPLFLSAVGGAGLFRWARRGRRQPLA